jgi:hypothetical protein
LSKRRLDERSAVRESFQTMRGIARLKISDFYAKAR